MTKEQIKKQIADLKDKLSMIRRGYDTSDAKPIIKKIKELQKLT